MGESGEILCVLSVVLLTVMVIGHGMWVVAAWLLRAIGGAGPVEMGKPCPQCTARYGVKNGRCVVCGAVPHVAPARQPLRDELKTTIGHIQRLAHRGVIAQQQCDELVAKFQAEIAELSPSAGSKLLPAPRQEMQPVAPPPGPGLVPAGSMGEVVDAILVEPPVSVPARASQPAAVHPLDRPYVPPPPRQPSRPARSLADMLQSFMEERNIRWGEILAAMLIVICSVGLVISLRNTLKAIPYFPAILFTLFTVSFHSAGLYTLRRWKLQAVSRVILLISLLLVPLTICGAIVMQQTRQPTDPLFLVALAAGIGIFTWVCYSASRELVGIGAWPLTIGVLGASLSQVAIQRMDSIAGDTRWLNVAAAMPLASFLVATGWQLLWSRRWRQLSQQRVIHILRVLGVAAFAVLPALALILVRSERWTDAVANLSPQLSLAAAMALALGLVIHRRTIAQKLAPWQTAGTAIVVLASVVLLLLLAAAWPEPELLLALGLMDCAIFAVLGVVAQLPFLYVPSVACAAMALAIGWHLGAGHFADREQLWLRVVQAAFRGQTSVVLAVVAAMAGALGGWLTLRKRSGDGLMLLSSSGGVALASLLIALFSGFVAVPDWPQDRDLSAVVLLVYALALIAAAPSLTNSSIGRWVAGCGSLVLWLAIVQALALNGTIRSWLEAVQWLPARPVLVATLCHGVLTAMAALAATGKSVLADALRYSTEQNLPRRRLLAEPLAVGAAISLTLAVPFLMAVQGGRFSASATMSVVAAVGWAALVTSQRWPGAVSAMQGMLALAPALFIAEIWRERDGGPNWAFNEQHIFAQLIAAALPTLFWSMTRRLTSDREILRRLFSPAWPAVDQVLLGSVAVALPIAAALRVLPHVGWELGFLETAVRPQFAAANDSFGVEARGWIALAVAIAAISASLWEHVRLPATIGMGVASLTAVWLAAAHFADDSAAASAARWAAAIYAVVWAVLYIARGPIQAAAKQIAALRWDRFPREAVRWFAAQPLVFGGTTILVITILAVQQHAGGIMLRGPATQTFFDNIGPTTSYVMPLAALIAVLLAYAVRERQAGFALGGAAVTQLAVNLAFLLHTSSADPAYLRAIEWLQWNAIGAGGFALVWLGLSQWITPPDTAEGKQRLAEGMWLIPIGIAGAAAVALVGWAAVVIIDAPASPPGAVVPLGSWLSFLSVGLVLVAVLWKSGGRVQIDGLGDAAMWLAAGMVPLIAASINRLDTGGQWLAFHTLQAGWLAVSAVGCGLACFTALTPAHSQRERGWIGRFAPHHPSVAILTGLVVWLAVRGNYGDPVQPWWSLGATLGTCAIATTLGLSRRSQPYAFASTALAGLVVALFWLAPATWPWVANLSSDTDLVRLTGVQSAVIAVFAMAAFWLWREIACQRRTACSLDLRPFMPRVHAFVAIGFVPLHFLLRLIFAFFYPGPGALFGFDVTFVVVSIALGGLLIGSLWDRRAVWLLPLLSIWGLAAWCLAIAMCGGWLKLPGARVTAVTLAFAAHAALSGQIWSYGANLAALGSRLGVSDPVGGLSRTAVWLVPVNLLLAVLVCAVDFLLVLTLADLPLRVAAALGPAVAAWGVLCLAQERRRDVLQLGSLLMVGVSAVYLAWAQIPPSHEAAVWLTRVFRLLMVLAALTFVYGLALPRLLLTSGPWNAATRKAGYIAGTATLATFVVTLILEVALFVPGVGAPVADVQVAAIAVVLLALIAGLISLALLPGRDPLVLSERGRQGYVYAAEVTAALLFAHLYVCKPLWFDGVLRPYWPLIVMMVAFIGVGAAELFQRFKIPVLAEPLARTGALLPLLPVLGWWTARSDVEYSLLLLIVGILYLALSFTQKSWAALAGAAVAGNGALWALLLDTDFKFATNPQLWLIPPALSVLAAAQLNRRRLAPETLAGVRYAATLVIYVSSTSEIFMRGFSVGLYPPMILLGLAVAGALAGIALRVQAFLFVGTTFTLVALLAMVRHAAHALENPWPWWVFGISLGVAVLVLLAVFEKNRAELTLLASRLRQWER